MDFPWCQPKTLFISNCKDTKFQRQMQAFAPFFLLKNTFVSPIVLRAAFRVHAEVYVRYMFASHIPFPKPFAHRLLTR